MDILCVRLFCLCLLEYVFGCLAVQFFAYLPMCLPVWLFVWFFVFVLCVCSFIRLVSWLVGGSVCLFCLLSALARLLIQLVVCLCVGLFVCVCVSLFGCLFVCVFVCVCLLVCILVLFVSHVYISCWLCDWRVWTSHVWTLSLFLVVGLIP